MRWVGQPAMSWPAKAITPAFGDSTPEIRLSAVVLPEPLGPSSADDLAGMHRQVDAVDSDETAERAGQAFDAKHWRCTGGHACAPRIFEAVGRQAFSFSQRPTTPDGSA